MKTVFSINEAFLKENGIELKPTGSQYMPYGFENDKIIITVSAFYDMVIFDKSAPKGTTRCRHVNLCMQLVENQDIFNL